MSWALVPVLIHMCKPPSVAAPTPALSGGGARKPFLRCESFRLLGSILSSNARSENVAFHFQVSKFLSKDIPVPTTSSVREHLEALMPELTKVLAVGLASPELSKGKHVKTLLQYAKALISWYVRGRGLGMDREGT